MSTVAPNSKASEVTGDSGVLRLLQAMEALVLLLTVKGKIIECNDVCERVSGFTEAELTGRNFAGVLATQSEMHLLQELVSRIAEDAPNDRIDSFILTKMGEQKRIRWSGVLLDQPDGTEPILLLTGTDVTREYELSLELETVKEQSLQLQSEVNQLSTGKTLLQASEIERRSDCRIRFAGKQRVAPYGSDRLPTDADFETVECYDLSARGMSFYLSNRPVAPEYILELGSRSSTVYFVASVKHVQSLDTPSGQRFLVGCRFAGRM